MSFPSLSLTIYNKIYPFCFLFLPALPLHLFYPCSFVHLNLFSLFLLFLFLISVPHFLPIFPLFFPPLPHSLPFFTLFPLSFTPLLRFLPYLLPSFPLSFPPLPHFLPHFLPSFPSSFLPFPIFFPLFLPSFPPSLPPLPLFLFLFLPSFYFSFPSLSYSLPKIPNLSSPHSAFRHFLSPLSTFFVPLSSLPFLTPSSSSFHLSSLHPSPLSFVRLSFLPPSPSFLFTPSPCSPPPSPPPSVVPLKHMLSLPGPQARVKITFGLISVLTLKNVHLNAFLSLDLHTWSTENMLEYNMYSLTVLT